MKAFGHQHDFNINQYQINNAAFQLKRNHNTKFREITKSSDNKVYVISHIKYLNRVLNMNQGNFIKCRRVSSNLPIVSFYFIFDFHVVFQSTSFKRLRAFNVKNRLS